LSIESKEKLIQTNQFDYFQMNPRKRILFNCTYSLFIDESVHALRTSNVMRRKDN